MLSDPVRTTVLSASVALLGALSLPGCGARESGPKSTGSPGVFESAREPSAAIGAPAATVARDIDLGAAAVASVPASCLGERERGREVDSSARTEDGAAVRASVRAFATCSASGGAEGPFVVVRGGERAMRDGEWQELRERVRRLFTRSDEPSVEAYDVGPCCDGPDGGASECLHLFMSGPPSDPAAYGATIVPTLELPEGACVPIYLHTALPSP